MIPKMFFSLSSRRAEAITTSIRPLTPAELRLVSGGAVKVIRGPSGAVYYWENGRIIGVDDPATGTCH